MTQRFRFILFGIIFSAFSAPVLAESHPSIQGQITEVRGYTMAGLTVRARNNSTGNGYETTSDGKGNFSFDGLEPGRYVLVAECEGIDRILGSVSVENSQTARVELLALPLAETGNTAVDK